MILLPVQGYLFYYLISRSVLYFSLCLLQAMHLIFQHFNFFLLERLISPSKFQNKL